VLDLICKVTNISATRLKRLKTEVQTVEKFSSANITGEVSIATHPTKEGSLTARGMRISFLWWCSASNLPAIY